MILKSTPDFASIKQPENKFRYLVWKFCESTFLEVFIMACIILNIVTMAMAYETSPDDYDNIVKDINLFFTIVFMAEMVLKLIAYGFKGYFHKGWNQFDFFVV